MILIIKLTVYISIWSNPNTLWIKHIVGFCKICNVVDIVIEWKTAETGSLAVLQPSNCSPKSIEGSSFDIQQ